MNNQNTRERFYVRKRLTFTAEERERIAVVFYIFVIQATKFVLILTFFGFVYSDVLYLLLRSSQLQISYTLLLSTTTLGLLLVILQQTTGPSTKNPDPFPFDEGINRVEKPC